MNDPEPEWESYARGLADLDAGRAKIFDNVEDLIAELDEI